MGANLGNNKGPMSEINVTPFVDVVLVLLIIFMITAPLMYNGIALKLPKTKKVNSLNLSQKQVILSFSLSEEIYIGKEKVLISELVKVVLDKFKETGNSTLFFRAHKDVKYGKVAKLISFLKKGGVTNIALVTEVENQK